MKESTADFTPSPSNAADSPAEVAALRALRMAARANATAPATVRSARLVRVKRSIRLTPNMQRVTLEGSELVGFPTCHEGAHVRIMLPNPSQSERDFAEQLAAGPKRPITRTYTVRHHRPDMNELDIDFALHADGRACQWAVAAEPGDFMAIAGPSAKKMTDFSASWFLLSADMTAIPAAAAVLEDMPNNAVGHAVFEITTEDDRQPVNAPPGIEIQWLVGDVCGQPCSCQLDAVRDLPWRDSLPGIFVAGESGATKALRHFLCEEKGVDRKCMYASAYWKIGMREDQHRKLKAREAAQQG
jgi:NADPH-dependent ferric siderophore reductase